MSRASHNLIEYYRGLCIAKRHAAWARIVAISDMPKEYTGRTVHVASGRY